MTTTPEELHSLLLMRLRSEGSDWAARRDTEIRAAAKDGLSYRKIGSYLGMSHTGIQKIVLETREQDKNGWQPDDPAAFRIHGTITGRIPREEPKQRTPGAGRLDSSCRPPGRPRSVGYGAEQE